MGGTNDEVGSCVPDSNVVHIPLAHAMGDDETLRVRGVQHIGHGHPSSKYLLHLRRHFIVLVGTRCHGFTCYFMLDRGLVVGGGEGKH